MNRRVVGAVVALTITCANCTQRGSAVEREGAPTWVDAWQAAPHGALPDRCIDPTSIAAFPGDRAENQTLRFALMPSVTGNAVRVRLSNRFGDGPLDVGHVTIARHGGGASLQRGTIRDVLFDGARSVTIPPQQDVTSDAIDMYVEAGRNLAVSIGIASSDRLTWHAVAPLDTYATYADQSDRTTVAGSTPFRVRLDGYVTLAGLEVRSIEAAHAIVALGDSLTDYGNAIPGKSWLDVLGKRLRQARSPHALVNAGIWCNAFTRTTLGGGVKAADRLDADVLDRRGVSHVIVFEGANDITAGATAPQVIAEITAIARRVRAAGVRVIVATLIPLNNGGAQVQATRRAINTWIKRTSEVDGVADFDAAVRSASNPDRISSAYNVDGIHVNAAGQRAMGNAIRLALFRANGNGASGR